MTILFKGIEDGSSDNAVESDDQITLQPLSGLDDFDGVFAWAQNAARSVGKVTRPATSSPFDLGPVGRVGAGKTGGRPAGAPSRLPASFPEESNPAAYLSGIEEVSNYDLGNLGFSFKKLKKFAKKTVKAVAKAPVGAAKAVKFVAKNPGKAVLAPVTGGASLLLRRPAPRPAPAPAPKPSILTPWARGGTQSSPGPGWKPPGKILPQARRSCPAGQYLAFPGTRSERCLPLLPGQTTQARPAPVVQPPSTTGWANGYYKFGQQSRDPCAPGYIGRLPCNKRPAAPAPTQPSWDHKGGVPPPIYRPAITRPPVPFQTQIPLPPPAPTPVQPSPVPSALTPGVTAASGAFGPSAPMPQGAPLPAVVAPAAQIPAAVTPQYETPYDEGYQPEAQPYDEGGGSEGADYAQAETVAQDEAASYDFPETPPEGPPPDAYAEPEAVEDPYYAEPDASIQPEEEPEPTMVNGLGYLLGATFGEARATKRLMSRPPTGWVEPRDLLTREGAARLGAAGAKAGVAAKLHKRRAKMMEDRIARLAEKGRKEKDPAARNRFAGEALEWSRKLMTERASEARAAKVAAGAKVALQYRQEAQMAGTDAQRRDLLGKAAAATIAAQTFAKAQVPVQLPAMLKQSNIDALKSGGAAPSVATTTLAKRKAQMPSSSGAKIGAKTRKRPQALAPQGLGPAGRGLPSNPFNPPVQRRGLPIAQMPAAMFASQYEEKDDTALVSTLRGLGGIDTLGGLGGTWDFLDSIKEAAQKVVAPNTAAGAALRGDWSTAFNKAAPVAIGTAQGLLKPKTPSAPGVPLTAQEREVLARIDGQSKSILGQTLPWLAAAGVAGIGIVFWLRSRRTA